MSADTALRLEALRLANNGPYAIAVVVSRADAFYKFLKGEK